jgi:hypothetical protein
VPNDFRTEGMAVEIVEWIDSNFSGRWQEKSWYDAEAERTMKCRSVGFVMKETADRVCLLQSEALSCFAEMLTIPKVAIVKRTVLVGLVPPEPPAAGVDLSPRADFPGAPSWRLPEIP